MWQQHSVTTSIVTSIIKWQSHVATSCDKCALHFTSQWQLTSCGIVMYGHSHVWAGFQSIVLVIGLWAGTGILIGSCLTTHYCGPPPGNSCSDHCQQLRGYCSGRELGQSTGLLGWSWHHHRTKKQQVDKSIQWLYLYCTIRLKKHLPAYSCWAYYILNLKTVAQH